MMDVKNDYTKNIEYWLQKEIEAVFPWLGVPFLEVSVFFEEKGNKSKILEIVLQSASFYLTIVVYPKFKRIWKQRQQKTLQKTLLLELAKIPVWDLVTLAQSPFKTSEEFEQIEERTVSLINFYTLNLIDLKNLKFPKLPQARNKDSLKKWIEKTIVFLTPIMSLPKIKISYQFFKIDNENGDIYHDFDPKTQRLTLRIYPYFLQKLYKKPVKPVHFLKASV